MTHQLLNAIELDSDRMVVVEVPLVATGAAHEPAKGFVILLDSSKFRQRGRAEPLRALDGVDQAQELALEVSGDQLFREFWNKEQSLLGGCIGHRHFHFSIYYRVNIFKEYPLRFLA